MASYAYWNNKGGVGKSFLCFFSAAEYAEKHPDIDVYVIDLCPQANVSETILGGLGTGSKALDALASESPRRTIAGYLEARLSSPFQRLPDIADFVTEPHKFNRKCPRNLKLICGDNLVELLSEAIRQTSQLALPADAWKRVLLWVADFVAQLRSASGERDSTFFIDCNPSFSVYTQQALLAADSVVVPFTPDDSSRRGIVNVTALVYGVVDSRNTAYSRISFSGRAQEYGIELPKLRYFVNNRVTMYEGKPSKAFAAASKTIKETIDKIHTKKRSIFYDVSRKPSTAFFDIPDNHSANVVCALTGTPLHKLQAGPHEIKGERVQVNQGPLVRYKKALTQFVQAL